jgi:MATE family multidrug resistance protein
MHNADYLIGYCQPTYCIWFSAESILLFLKQDPEVAHLAAVYLRWVSFGLPGMIFSPFPD